MHQPADWKSRLNEAQRRAVEHDGAPMIILAGPGTGKTSTIIARMRRLIEDGADPSSILALTFGKKATQEIRSRLAATVGVKHAESIQAQTFHGFGRSILLRFGDMIGFRPNAMIIDSAQRKRLIRSLIRAHKLFPRQAATGYEGPINASKKFISDCRHASRTPDEAIAYGEQWVERVASQPGEGTPEDRAARAYRAAEFLEHARLFKLFDHSCREMGLTTFEDFICDAVKLLRTHSIVGQILRSEIRHVLVDEFQDVNASQIELIRGVAPPILDSGRMPDLCVVGDDDQAIYAFRGADTQAFTRFAAVWKQHEVIELTENYRSAKPIVAAANRIIVEAGERFRPDKVLVSAGAAAKVEGSVEGVTVTLDPDMGQTIGAMILHDRQRNPERNWSDYCVLVRAGTFRDQIASSLETLGIPIDQGKTATPLDDQGVQDLLAWMRLLVDPAEASAASRLLIRPPLAIDPLVVNEWRRQHERARADGELAGFIDWVCREKSTNASVVEMSRLLGILRTRAAHEPADRVVEGILREAALIASEALEPRQRASRVANLVRLIRFARERQPVLDPPGDLAALLSYYEDLDNDEKQFVSRESEEELDGNGDEAEMDRDCVRIITAHKAKGLEFDTVFVARVRSGSGFPSSDKEDKGAIELPSVFSGSAASDHADEERRLFYVAATRARRRLVVLAKAAKSITKNTDFFNELTVHAGADAIPVITGAEWINRAGLTPPDDAQRELAQSGSAEARRLSYLHQEIARHRQMVYAALHEAEGALLGNSTLERVEAHLRSAAGNIASIAHLRERGSLPEILPTGADAESLSKIHALVSRLARDDSFVLRMKAPLSLSFSMLKSYQDCPRCFYLKYVLRLDEPKTDQLSLGDVVHRVLEQFTRDLRDAESEGRGRPSLQHLLNLAVKQYRQSWPMSRPYSEEGLEQVRAQLTLYYNEMEDDAEIREVEKSIKFAYLADGQSHHFTAKIDRIDQLPDGTWRIVDYKTGTAWKRLLEPPRDDLQLCVYSMALSHLYGAGDDPMEGTAEYWVLSEGKKGSIALRDLRLDKAREQIDKAVAGILAGHYGKSNKCSGFCDLIGPDVV